MSRALLASRWLDLTRSRHSLRVGKVCNTDNREIAEAIYEVDWTPLQGPEVPPEQADQAASTCTFGLSLIRP